LNTLIIGIKIPPTMLGVKLFNNTKANVFVKPESCLPNHTIYPMTMSIPHSRIIRNNSNFGDE